MYVCLFNYVLLCIIIIIIIIMYVCINLSWKQATI